MNLDTFRIQFFASAPRYEWLELLGRGGMGVVFKARDLVLDEIVAIKVLYGHVADDDGAVVARFKREISLNRKVKHPNVARMYDFGTSGGHPFITMEFVPGKDLQTLILEEGRIAAMTAKESRERISGADPGTVRPITPGDVMILVRRRDAFFEAMVANDVDRLYEVSADFLADGEVPKQW